MRSRVRYGALSTSYGIDTNGSRPVKNNKSVTKTSCQEAKVAIEGSLVRISWFSECDRLPNIVVFCRWNSLTRAIVRSVASSVS